mgnify:CR=1 FL=1
MTPKAVKKEDVQRGTCGCGRSPTGDCIGWHGLSEDQYRVQLAEYEAKALGKNSEQNQGS